VRLLTTEEGLHEASYEALFPGGRGRRGVTTDSLRLSRQGKAVAFHVEPQGARFVPGSRLYFLSEGAGANPYGREAVYELEWSGGGVSMEAGSAAPFGEPALSYIQRDDYEENRLYQAGLLEAPDLWLWDVLMAPVAKSFGFWVRGLASGPSRLTVRLQGVSDFASEPDHHVRLSVNGIVQNEVTWDGKESRTIELVVPEGGLREGENHLEIANVGDTEAPYSMVMLDRFQVAYPRVVSGEGGRLEGLWTHSGTVSAELGASHLLDVTEGSPRWLSGAGVSSEGTLRFRAEAGRRYLAVSREAVLRPLVRSVVPARLKKETLQADYLVVGPSDFASAAATLLEHRSRQGLRVKFAALEDVYSEFGFGEARPEAIREFLSYAYHHWQGPRLRYVLLLGDATYDFKDYLQTGVANQLPPLMVKTSYLWTASDPT
ncbi:MAG: C25 family cysteine peptidase, partial [Vicinamibacteria bacterium]